MNLTRAIVISLLLVSTHFKICAQPWTDFIKEVGEKKLVFEDKIYEDYIRSVTFYNSNGSDRIPIAPIVPLGSVRRLAIEFDDITDDSDDYYAKLIHCNHDWVESGFKPIEYLNEYNEYNLNDFEFSINTKVPYVHYRFNLPPVKISGNYLLVIYRGGDDEDLILTRRIVAFEESVRIGAKVEEVIGSGDNISKQQVNFSVFYGGANIEVPAQNVLVTIRQNFRWQTAIKDLKPLFVKQHISELDFNYFNLENAFPGGNEFRFFDTGYRNAGLQVEDVTREDEINTIYLFKDKPRDDRVYNSQRLQNDFNGRFIPGSRSGSGNAGVEADYNIVQFVLGSFNDWELEEENKLSYNADKQTYEGSMLLKQGRYDYNYALYKEGKLNEQILEGSFGLAENEYDIIVYYTPLAGRGDRVVGYQTIQVNK
jgi:hypothetical protein